MNPARAVALGSALLLASASVAADESRTKFSAALSAEGRGYLHDPAYAGQNGAAASASLSLEPELYVEWSRNTSATITPFARWDSIDEERSHIDLRELALQQRFGNFDLRLGVSRVFWGVTESVHLVDIINQTDQVENIDGEDKLGQPMAMLSWTTDAGVFTGFVLPYFRERTLPGPDGRFRSEFTYAQNDAIYESSDEEHHVDGALRWSLSTSLFDLGLSYFNGTGRSPRFAPRVTTSDPGALAQLLDQLGLAGLLGQLAQGQVDDVSVDLVPVYDQIEQTGLDLNLVSGNWIWKLEAIYQDSRARDYGAAAGGFEYTYAGAFNSAWDASLLMEYLWDSRGDDTAPLPTAEDLQGNMLPPQQIPPLFQNDLFVGTRLTPNDVASTEFLAGVVVDLDHGGLFASVETSRRLGSAGKLALELRIFADAQSQDPLYLLRDDDYLQLEYTHYF
ncbi:hypothetical protein E4T66_12235 [Sinimarinibacterium sp. CAU 1509]|uniref:hypothetical protein n=1 Tax=Sinimarinibacterium sp. CAU 1509 TaxID=2562283 RepID=UPI0010AD8A22|nr:hypothetical protein [Sinimarinibacterium sp. CAU 1509]TJY59944.1 hypothetical protein E4T66_12235 [Sinimarinibacterium sp. CAU 1509]